MKDLTTLIGSILLCTTLFSQTSGGPDTYGYEWRDSNDPNGPTYSWLNIQDVGVQVNGLTDDNSSSQIAMGMDFHYYWYDVNQIVIGSNGWISFDQVSNIAHCFPIIPLAGGAADNYLAPLMTDLIMNAAGTNARVYYWFDSSNDRFVISYLDVPWWQQATPGYVGINSFQVILSTQDSSITFQYKDMEQLALADNAACTEDLIIGIENITGNIGLGLTQYTENVPPDNYAIRFYPPTVALIAIPDATPVWNQNTGNKGFFVESGTNFTLQTDIKNVGNADITTDINVSVELEDLQLVQAFSSSDIISGLTAGSNSVLDLTPDANLSPGQYFFNTVLTNASDINPGNNTRITEVNAVDVSLTDVVLSFATQDIPDANVGWTGGGGMGVFIEPPMYPCELTATDFFVAAGISGASEFTVEILAADGTDGLPGTVLETVNVIADSYTADAWVNVPLGSPVLLTSGGVYIAFIHGADGVFLGTETAGPVSRQTYEFVGGTWAVYRENTAVDVLINGHFDFSATVGMDNQQKNNGLFIFPNPSNGQFEVVSKGNSNGVIVEVFNALGELVYQTDMQTAKLNIDLEDRPSGIYIVRLKDDEHIVTLKVILE